MKYQVSYVQTCLPDYFGGHHLPTVQVDVYRNTTYRDLLDGLKSYMATDHITTMDDGSEFKLELFLAALEDTFDGVNLDDSFPPAAWVEEPEDEDNYDGMDMVYAYFVIKVNKEGDDEDE